MKIIVKKLALYYKNVVYLYHNNSPIKHTDMKTLTGTEKQISYANSLLNEMTARIERMVEKGRQERVQNQIDFIAAITDNANAGNIIEICNNFDFFAFGVTDHGKTWSECIEKGRNIR